MQNMGDNIEPEMLETVLVNLLCDAPRWVLGGQVVFLPRTCRDLFQNNLQSAIPEVSQMMIIAGYDWMGRPIGVSSKVRNTVLLYDSMFDELMEFDILDNQFESSPLFEPTSNNFGQEEYLSFVTSLGLPHLEFGICAGYTIPPQLGGLVSSMNMEIYSLFDYWRYISLLHQAIADLPVGTVLKSIMIKQ